MQVSSSYLIPNWSYEQKKKLSMLILFTEFVANSNTLHGTGDGLNCDLFVFPITFDRNYV